jgi:hypothetical protein
MSRKARVEPEEFSRSQRDAVFSKVKCDAKRRIFFESVWKNVDSVALAVTPLSRKQKMSNAEALEHRATRLQEPAGGDEQETKA